MNSLPESDFLDLMQEQWDAHRQRVGSIVDAAPSPVVVSSLPRRSHRRLLLVANGLLTLMSIAFFIYWVLTAAPFAYTLPRQVFAVAFGIFLVGVAVACGASFVSLLLFRPLRVSPHQAERLWLLGGLPSILRRRGGSPAVPTTVHGLRLALLSLFLVSTFAASACTSAADDYFLRQSNRQLHSRTVVVESVANLLRII